MRNFTPYLAAFLCLFLSKGFSQETFENRAKAIANTIENITKEEKNALKLEVEAVNVDLEKGILTKVQADDKKKSLADTRAKNIETRVAVEQEKLSLLIKEKVEGKIIENNKKRSFTFSAGVKDTLKKSETRTTSQFVFAAGVNNLVTNNQVANSDFRYWGSHFYEWGISFNSRIMKNNNLLHAKYGLSVMYNNLRATDNRYFQESGNQTYLQTSNVTLKDSRFRNVNLVVPIHLEFDFSGNKTKSGKPFYKTHDSFRIGFGGYAGVNVKSKQILEYTDSNGNSVTERTKGDFNTNDFIYGLSTYIGYKETSLYLKYDLNPLFKNNPVKQNNISLGIRFDLN